MRLDRTDGFNPRPRAGGDPQSPTRALGYTRFNPRPRAGGDLLHPKTEGNSLQFQSTPPRGGRLRNLRITIRLLCFNPRPRAGGDALDEFRKEQGHVSIHAPARGATE